MKKVIILMLIFKVNFVFCNIKDSAKTSKFNILPVVYYQPETNVAFEAFAIYNFKLKNARYSNIRFFNAYTLNKQFISILPWQIFTKNEKFLHLGRIEFKYFPEYFYGVSNQTCETMREIYTYKTLNINPKILKKLNNHYFAGGDLQFVYNQNETSSNSQFFNSQNSLLGQNKYNLFSLGINLIKDSRDFILNPKNGQYFEFKQNFFVGKADNQNYEFCRVIFDYRLYKSLNSNTVFANQIFSQIGVGKMPFREMATIGGPNILRGYYQGRFRDESALFYQTELRKMISKKWGFAIHSGVGKVFNQNNFINQQHYNYSVGCGLRYLLNKENQSTIRLDYGLTPDSQGFYVYFSEAF